MVDKTNKPGWKFKPKSEAEKEITAWANGGSYANATSSSTTTSSNGPKTVAIRKVGMTQNVTEERMLRGQILDLSKERYKTIKEKDGLKNRFLDRQQKKAKTLTHLLENIDFEQNKSKSVQSIEKSKIKTQELRHRVLLGYYGQYLTDFQQEDLMKMNKEEILKIVQWKKSGGEGILNQLSTLSTTTTTTATTLTAQTNNNHNHHNIDNDNDEELYYKHNDADDKKLFHSNSLFLTDIRTYDENGHQNKRLSETIPSRTINHRGSLYHRQSILFKQQKFHKSQDDSVNDPRCRNLIQSLIPLPAGLNRPLSRKTLPTLLHSIDSLSYSASPRSSRLSVE